MQVVIGKGLFDTQLTQEGWCFTPQQNVIKEINKPFIFDWEHIHSCYTHSITKYEMVMGIIFVCASLIIEIVLILPILLYFLYLLYFYNKVNLVTDKGIICVKFMNSSDKNIFLKFYKKHKKGNK